jgi:hypothetical protein
MNQVWSNLVGEQPKCSQLRVVMVLVLTGCDDRTTFERKYEASSEKIAREAKAMDADMANGMGDAEGSALPDKTLR